MITRTLTTIIWHCLFTSPSMQQLFRIQKRHQASCYIKCWWLHYYSSMVVVVWWWLMGWLVEWFNHRRILGGKLWWGYLGCHWLRQRWLLASCRRNSDQVWNKWSTLDQPWTRVLLSFHQYRFSRYYLCCNSRSRLSILQPHCVRSHIWTLDFFQSCKMMVNWLITLSYIITKNWILCNVIKALNILLKTHNKQGINSTYEESHQQRMFYH